MLRVTIELVPGGDERSRRSVGSMTIGNISGLADIGDYVVSVTEGHNPLTGAAPLDRRFVVRGHPRPQSVWMLVKRAITEMEDST